MKLRKDRIHQKKPKDSIREKTPDNTHNSNVIGKIPKDAGESFALPPRKPLHNDNIPKSEVIAPSNHGSQKMRPKDISPTNTPPPMENKSFKDIRTKRPADHGKIQKSKVQSHTPRRTQEKRRELPSRKGLDKSKKSRKSINKPLSKQIRTKTPRKTTIRSPPATSQLEKKKIDRKFNQSPPSKISQKTPKQKRPLPPPTVRHKIPKTTIKGKKPK